MIATLQHKGYVGTIDTIDTIDAELDLLSGTVLGMRDVIHFEGRGVAEARASFEAAVDDYLEFCASEGVEPDKPKSGKFQVRVGPDVHRRIEAAARASGVSLNEWVARHLAAASSADKAIFTTPGHYEGRVTREDTYSHPRR